MCVTDRYDMTLAVKVALNPNTINQITVLPSVCRHKTVLNVRTKSVQKVQQDWFYDDWHCTQVRPLDKYRGLLGQLSVPKAILLPL